MENFTISKRATSDKKRAFVQDVKRAKIAVVTFLLSHNIKIKISKTDIIFRKRESSGIVFGGFWLYDGANIGKNRIADFDFFPDARMHIHVYYPKPNSSVLNVVNLELVSDLSPVISSFMEMIISVYEIKKQKKNQVVRKTGHC